MAEFKIILSADTKGAQTGINQVVQSVESLRKKYITGKGSLEEYNQALNDQLAHNNTTMTKLKALESNYKLLNQELSRTTLAFGENADVVKQIASAYEHAGDNLKKYKEELATINQQSKDRETKAQLEQEAQAIENTRKYYRALGDSMGYAQNEANILNEALKKVIANGADDKAINDAASAYLKQKDAIAEVAKQEELYLAQVKNAISQEKAREQAVEDANNASLESWKRYTNFVAQQQAKISGYSLADSSRTSYNSGASVSTVNFSSYDNNMAYYKQIGDEVSYAREEVSMYADELKRLMSLNAENVSSQSDLSDAIKNTTASYKASKERLDSLTTSTDSYFTKLVSLTKNIFTFQLLLQPIRKAMSFLSDTIKESVQAAAEAEQVFSKLATVFSGLETSATSMAQSLSSSIGVANSTAASALSTVGDMLQAQGMGTAESLQVASEWVEKFQDIIAFKDINMDLEEFAQNFMSGATGNLRNFRTFGSIIKESAVQAELAKRGLDSLTGSELELEKMVIRAEMALEQQANAIGATNREWETTQSITRRYDEANKQLKENIGDAINSKLNPLKQLWADIAEQINKATKAQKEYANGTKDIKVYDIANNADDKKSFSNKIKTEVINPRNALGGRYVDDTNSINQLVSIMTQYQATVEDIKAVWSDMPDNIYDSLVAEQEILEAEREHERLLASLSASWTSVSESAADAVAKLEEVTGVDTGISGTAVNNFLSADNPTTKAGLLSMSEELAKELQDAIESAISSFGAADWQTFVSSLDLAFGTATETEGLDAKIEQVKTLYSTVNSLALEDNVITSEEQENLKAILAIYQQILDRQRAITDEAEAQQKLEERKQEILNNYNTALSTQTGNTADYEKQLAQLRMTDNQKALNDLDRAYSAIDKTGFSDDQLIALRNAYEESKETLIELQEETAKYNAELEAEAKLKEEAEKRTNTINSYNEGTADYQKQLAQIDMTDSEKIIADLEAALTGTDDELDNAIKAQIKAYEELTAETKKRTDQEKRQNSIDSFVGLKDSNVLSLEQFGMTEEEQALDNLKRAYEALDLDLQTELAEEYQKQQNIITELYKKQADYNAKLEEEAKIKEAQEKRDTTIQGYQTSTASYQTQLRQLRMTDYQKTVDDLVQQLTGDDAIDEAIQDQLVAYTNLYAAQEKYTKELESAAAWQNLGQNALGSLGTVGGAVNTLLYGEGDIWTRILSVCLDIFQQSESWSDLVTMLDNIIEPLLPIVESIVDLLSSMEFAFDIVTFCVKVIASLITSILAGIEMVVDVFEWAWDNIKIAFSNLGKDIYNWTHWGADKQKEEYRSLASYLNETVEKQNDRLDRIWSDMPKESDNLSTLEDLLSRNIINLDQYNAGLRVANKDMVFDPVSPVNYVASNTTPGTTIQYGNVTLTINGGNVAETQRVVLGVLRKAGYDVPNVPITA